MEEIMLKIDNVSKQYKLGQIGGTTLREELQRKHALRHGKEDPTKKIGAKDYKIGETFMALNGVSFEVKKGEHVGIIGHNGAGKSTLLKLISRVTAPTGGAIYMNGRVTSMLEVGTGFSGELTGRENIYMNGAILGMTKKEIDAKIEDIIEFSEVRQFIDTPVKRYSSGMYVKLAFSVAAHLDSEIIIMDEVLAVGDVNFQQKCLQKMKTVAEQEGRTVLYVSHNMSTIRQLCDRCVVLEKGRIIYDGDVEQAIQMYIGMVDQGFDPIRDLTKEKRKINSKDELTMAKLEIINNDKDELRFLLGIESQRRAESAFVRLVVFDQTRNAIGAAYSETFTVEHKYSTIELTFSKQGIAPGIYYADLILGELENHLQVRQDLVTNVIHFEILEDAPIYHMKWNSTGWGHIVFNKIAVEGKNE